MRPDCKRTSFKPLTFRCCCLHCCLLPPPTPRAAQRNTASAGTLSLNPVGLNFLAAGRFGGSTKSIYSFRFVAELSGSYAQLNAANMFPVRVCPLAARRRTSSDLNSSSAAADYRSVGIAAPGVGRVTGRSGADALVMTQANTTAVNTTTSTTGSSSQAEGGPAPIPFKQKDIGKRRVQQLASGEHLSVLGQHATHRQADSDKTVTAQTRSGWHPFSCCSVAVLVLSSPLGCPAVSCRLQRYCLQQLGIMQLLVTPQSSPSGTLCDQYGVSLGIAGQTGQTSMAWCVSLCCVGVGVTCLVHSC